MFVWARDVIKQPLCINTWNGLLSGGINREQKHPVRKAQNPRKLLPKIPRARVQMRLKDQRQFALGPLFANGMEQGFEFGGMVGVIVDVHAVGSVEVHVHASFDSAEVCHHVLEDIGSNTCFRRQDGRHQCVGRVVATWQGRTRAELDPRTQGKMHIAVLRREHRHVGNTVRWILAFVQDGKPFKFRSLIGGWPCQTVGQKEGVFHLRSKLLKGLLEDLE